MTPLEVGAAILASLGGVAGVGAGTKAAWHFLVVERVRRAEAEATAKTAEALEWKTAWKAEVAEKRKARIAAETATLGAPSVAPPREEQNTITDLQVSAEDKAWFRALERKAAERDDARRRADFENATRAKAVERELSRYTLDMASTPPTPYEPPPPSEPTSPQVPRPTPPKGTRAPHGPAAARPPHAPRRRP